jgi:hypothetical protein
MRVGGEERLVQVRFWIRTTQGKEIKKKINAKKKRKIEGVRGEGGAWINLKTISTKSVAENVRSQTVETIVTPGYVQCILIVGKKKNLQ